MAAASQQVRTKAAADRVEAADAEMEEEEEVPYCLVEKLQDAGINAADLKKLKDAGFNTSQSIVFAMRKELLSIKGLSEQKVDKIIEAARKTTNTMLLLIILIVDS